MGVEKKTRANVQKMGKTADHERGPKVFFDGEKDTHVESGLRWHEDGGKINAVKQYEAHRFYKIQLESVHHHHHQGHKHIHRLPVSSCRGLSHGAHDASRGLLTRGKAALRGAACCVALVFETGVLGPPEIGPPPGCVCPAPA